MNLEKDAPPRSEMDMLILNIFANLNKLEQVLADSGERLADMNHRLDNINDTMDAIIAINQL